MGYYIKKIYHKRPVPAYILHFVEQYGEFAKNISKADAQMFLRTIKYGLEEFQYKRRNAMETLGVTHIIQMCDTEITVYTIHGKPVVSFKVEKIKED